MIEKIKKYLGLNKDHKPREMKRDLRYLREHGDEIEIAGGVEIIEEDSKFAIVKSKKPQKVNIYSKRKNIKFSNLMKGNDSKHISIKDGNKIYLVSWLDITGDDSFLNNPLAKPASKDSVPDEIKNKAIKEEI